MENLQSKNFPKNEYLEIVELEKTNTTWLRLS